MNSDPARVLILGHTDYIRARSYAPELLTDSQLQVFTVPPRPADQQDPLFQRLHYRLDPGTLLVRNIWRPGEYVEATVAYEELSLQKFNLVASVCQRLGATRLEVTEIQELAEDGRQTGAARLSVLAGRGSVSFSNDTTGKLARRLEARWKWPGGPVDDAGAVELTSRTGLSADQIVMGLIDQRRYQGNRLSEHRLELDLTAEARREVKAAVEVQSFAGKLGPSFAADLTLLKKQSSTIRLVLDVGFL